MPAHSLSASPAVPAVLTESPIVSRAGTFPGATTFPGTTTFPGAGNTLGAAVASPRTLSESAA